MKKIGGPNFIHQHINLAGIQQISLVPLQAQMIFSGSFCIDSMNLIALIYQQRQAMPTDKPRSPSQQDFLHKFKSEYCKSLTVIIHLLYCHSILNILCPTSYLLHILDLRTLVFDKRLHVLFQQYVSLIFFLNNYQRTSTIGIGIINLPPHSLMKLICPIISSLRFHGKINT